MLRDRVAHAPGRSLVIATMLLAVNLADTPRAPPEARRPLSARPVERVDAAPPRTVSPPPPPTSSWPRLTFDGLAGMTAEDMASFGALVAAFPGTVLTPRWSLHRLELDPPIYEPFALLGHFLGFSGSEHYVEIDVDGGRATRVTVTRPGVVTEHGLQIHEPLAGLLRVREGRRCEVNRYFRDSSQMFESFVRCRVVAGQGELRYDASVRGMLSFGEHRDPGPVPTGAALDRWIADSGFLIDEITWLPSAR